MLIESVVEQTGRLTRLQLSDSCTDSHYFQFAPNRNGFITIFVHNSCSCVDVITIPTPKKERDIAHFESEIKRFIARFTK